MSRSQPLSPAFRRHILGIVDIPERDLDRLVEELCEHWSETAEEFVRRRHRELQKEGVPNREVYRVVVEDLKLRPFAAAERTERQIRRVIYG